MSPALTTQHWGNLILEPLWQCGEYSNTLKLPLQTLRLSSLLVHEFPELLRLTWVCQGLAIDIQKSPQGPSYNDMHATICPMGLRQKSWISSFLSSADELGVTGTPELSPLCAMSWQSHQPWNPCSSILPAWGLPAQGTAYINARLACCR